MLFQDWMMMILMIHYFIEELLWTDLIIIPEWLMMRR